MATPPWLYFSGEHPLPHLRAMGYKTVAVFFSPHSPHSPSNTGSVYCRLLCLESTTPRNGLFAPRLAALALATHYTSLRLLTSASNILNERELAVLVAGPLQDQLCQGHNAELHSHRIRRKRCSHPWELSAPPPTAPCGSCERLKIECLGYSEKRPQWMASVSARFKYCAFFFCC